MDYRHRNALPRCHAGFLFSAGYGISGAEKNIFESSAHVAIDKNFPVIALPAGNLQGGDVEETENNNVNRYTAHLLLVYGPGFNTYSASPAEVTFEQISGSLQEQRTGKITFHIFFEPYRQVLYASELK